ncbi:MAG: isochorismatase family protein [Clostridia bacterium]|nr:isochorismatase family protein [Clostridia bacterium]
MREDLLTGLDREVLEVTGYRAVRGMGERPALVVIDAQNKFVGRDEPILESMKTYPISIGSDACRSVRNIRILLDRAREGGIPVFYSTSGVPASELRFNSFAKKRTPHEIVTPVPADSEDIVEMLSPRPEDVVIKKCYASAFFGTPLMSYLNTLKIDTLIVTGFVTSGCVRAFVVDAASYNFNVCVVEECVADRFRFAHDMTLLDMDIKYADVIGVDKAIGYLDSFRGRP